MNMEAAASEFIDLFGSSYTTVWSPVIIMYNGGLIWEHLLSVMQK